MKRSRERTLIQFRITEDERRRLKHEAIDQGITLGDLVRKALGFPVRVELGRAGTAVDESRTE